MFVPPIVINQRISASHEPEHERSVKGEHGEEEHLKRSYAETS
jgi:hypothetical protein